jgi:hypothetical protein
MVMTMEGLGDVRLVMERIERERESEERMEGAEGFGFFLFPYEGKP